MKKRRTGVVDGAIAMLLRSFLRICAALPLSLLFFLTSCVSWLVWPFKTTARRITERNIAIAFPEKPAVERARLAKNSFSQFFRSAADLGPSWLWSADRVLERVASVVGDEHLQASVDEGRGVILLLPHLGNWEVIGTYIAARYPATTLYKEISSAAVNEVILQARQRHGNTLVPANKSGVRALMGALKSNELIIILPDQTPARGSGEFAPFFGEPALTMTLVTNLINRFGCKAVLAYAKYQHDNSFELTFRPAEEEIYSADSETALAGLNKSVEQCIVDCPEQYRWEYKRFKWLSDCTRRESY